MPSGLCSGPNSVIVWLVLLNERPKHKRIMTGAGETCFTPEEANRMLPLVRRIVDDILATGTQMKELATRPSPAPEHVNRHDKLAQRLQSLFGELDELGCYYKDWNFNVGLVDFPAWLNGRKVLLCSRTDEPAVTHYHAYEDGYAGRRVIPQDLSRVSPPPG